MLLTLRENLEEFAEPEVSHMLFESILFGLDLEEGGFPTIVSNHSLDHFLFYYIRRSPIHGIHICLE